MIDSDPGALEAAAFADAEGVATAEQRRLLEADAGAWRRALERLVMETERALASARTVKGPERAQVVADVKATLRRLKAASQRAGGPVPDGSAAIRSATTSLSASADPAREMRLQGSWSAGRLVVWAGGRGVAPADNDGLADRLEAIGAPPLGWELHRDIGLPNGEQAAALSIPLADGLGWLVEVGRSHAGIDGTEPAEAGADSTLSNEVGPSLVWLGRVALLGVRLVTEGSVVPSVRRSRRQERSGQEDVAVEWRPALVGDAQVRSFASAMPPAVAAITPSAAGTVVRAVLTSVVNAIVTQAAARVEVPAPPPVTSSAALVAEAVITRLDGSTFTAPTRAAEEVSTQLTRWAATVTGGDRPVLTIALDPPDDVGAWLLSVLGPGADGTPLPIERALADSKNARRLEEELVRLERAFPALLRPGAARRGQVYLAGDEAWELMTRSGPSLRNAGFDVRVPALSRRRPVARLQLSTTSSGDPAVGARQLSDVRWSAVFDDVKLSADEVARLAAEARPLVRSRGKWVELDRADLEAAAAALEERAAKTQLTGAEVLRHAVGLEGSPLAGGLSVEGEGWAADLLRKAETAATEPAEAPEGFVGTLRSYQADALGWLSFLDTVQLGGCLALDMGLGKTPIVLAHVLRDAGSGPTLVIAPAAVVGNWAAEAARFTPSLRVVVHHGATRSSAEDLRAEAAGADIVVTTYGTALRDVDALTAVEWSRLVVDEAQALKNPASDTARELRRIPAGARLALTGTPIENGLGDLWAILDFTNPGLVGSRQAFMAQLSGEPDAALSALNGILVFRHTKEEPAIATELPDKVDELDHCTMSAEQIGLYQAVLNGLVTDTADVDESRSARQGQILAAITALKQICNHPAAYHDDGRPLAGRSGKLARLEELVDAIFSADERLLVFTHFAEWGKRLADHLTDVTGISIACYHGGLPRRARDTMVGDFQESKGAGALVLSLKAGGTGLNLTAANHVVLYDRWWNPAVEDQARDRAWRIGQEHTVVSHRLICPGTVDERVEEVVAGKRRVADLVLPRSSSLADLEPDQLRSALGLREDTLLTDDS
ncbi:MAG TPA: DEAD/DEAH box helicase [Acidimicrobiales bacterium]|nr:DEAD/DEAH box helicase [Acidimicrobiales bacterium]